MKSRIVEALIISALVAVATFAASAVSSSASRADVVEALKAHGEHPHIPTEWRLTRLESVDGTQNEKLARLEVVEREVRGITARIDMLLLRETDTPRQKARMRRAAAKVRSNALERGEAGDPLSGLSEDL